MKDEIKEILDEYITDNDWIVIETNVLKYLKDCITNLQEIEKEHKNCTRKHWQEKCAEHHANETIYKLRIDKAIEYIKDRLEEGCLDKLNYYDLHKIENILQGDDKE